MVLPSSALREANRPYVFYAPGPRGGPYNHSMTETTRDAGRTVPEKPTLDGLEETWSRRWEEQGTYAFAHSRWLSP